VPLENEENMRFHKVMKNDDSKLTEWPSAITKGKFVGWLESFHQLELFLIIGIYFSFLEFFASLRRLAFTTVADDHRPENGGADEMAKLHKVICW
jgi:hypothetical protein